ncbi:MAG: tRNA uridine-5-carboxymethylaminomethyl(34) synthesis enzyme MnmG [Candidatus Gygaella obscura]|nr:tRNA uridine-5-carboxymethylaminomethyl(34) synthesis enzyme MnmG [Candidatus Gygaella obscura]
MKKFDVIVIGAGHAGIEAALVCARLKCKTALITFKFDTIGEMSCNPAIGGVGKGQLVKELDCLGGEIAKAADSCAIQMRTLNASKGQAVRSTRAQIDMRKYKEYMQGVVSKQKNLTVIAGEAKELLLDKNQVKGVAVNNDKVLAKNVVIAAGTFLNGVIHVGLKHHSAGRINESPSISLPGQLKNIGFNILRFKTGTCARIDQHSIDYSKLIEQKTDLLTLPFSFQTKRNPLEKVSCFIAYTNKKTHRIIKSYLKESPLYSGKIKATGVRYCPSIEDKIVKFPEKQRHQVFLEPQGLDTDWIYCNGISTSLPEKAQDKMIHSIKGLENAKIFRYGYGIEHDVVDSTQLYPTLESKIIRSLYFAGQVDGTTGYEEAASLGFIAGVNAARKVKGRKPIALDRAQGYIGVLIDDLVTKGTNEPYRMFTSRVEYRLLLREDNADLRLNNLASEIGILPKSYITKVDKKQNSINKLKSILCKITLKPDKKIINSFKKLGVGLVNKKYKLSELLKRPQVDIGMLTSFIKPHRFDKGVLIQVEIDIKYEGFIKRQLAEVERFKHLENIKIADRIDYDSVPALSREIKEKLNKFKPLNLGQASRISGVTPAAVSILMVYLKKLRSEKRI